MGGIKKKLKRALAQVRSVRVWQLILILIPLLFLAATLLRFDHLKMAELRSAVISADALGDAEVLESALVELQEFVFTHIVINVIEENGNQFIVFGTGPFYLEQSYRRAADAAIAATENTLADDANPNGNIYEAVRQICQPLAIQNGWQWSSQGYLDCWTSELAKYPTSDELSPNLIMASIPSTELYRRSYASPIWAPTAAGFVILICFILSLVVIARILIYLILQLALLFVNHRVRKH